MWLPLESNPDMLNGFARKAGLQEPWEFVDVFGLDDELLCMVPQPCVAVTLLFPTAKIRPHREPQRKQIEAEGQLLSDKLFFVKQVTAENLRIAVRYPVLQFSESC
ncbi:hypothetical protein CYMTET_22355 [Cymbomonas tetramitiformis]|uniref:Ubiquitin carboxyl-terminal hydrolase n=1 Tax=Cymbomonas tetramitiformis TaxID=36881 RepID=A0AAE0G067_9CHLO|nr:hypothetical protein CYMTET_22355 [Cymbomonas tetramitiformis]